MFDKKLLIIFGMVLILISAVFIFGCVEKNQNATIQSNISNISNTTGQPGSGTQEELPPLPPEE